MIRSTRSALGALAAALLAAACGDASSLMSPAAEPAALGPSFALYESDAPPARFKSPLVNVATGGCFATAGGSSANQTPAVLASCNNSAAQTLNLPAIGTAGSIFLFDGALCVDDFGAHGQVGDVVGTYTCYPGAAPQTWTLTSTGALIGINGLCVTATGSTITLQPCAGLATQRWTAPSAGSATTTPTTGPTTSRLSSALVNVATGGCFATAGGSSANQTPAVLASCNNSAAQTLNLPAIGTAGSIFLFDGALCVDDFGARGQVGDVVGTYTCYPGAAPQTWTLTSTGALVGINGLCVTATGSTITLQPCAGLATQRWTAPSAGSATTTPTTSPTTSRLSSALVNVATGGCFATAGGSSANQTPAVLASCNNSAAQTLNLPAIGTAGSIFLFDGALCVDDFGARGQVGDVVGTYTCYPGAAPQTWTLKATGELVGINGLCVTATGSTITLQPCTGLATQRWTAPGAGQTVSAVVPAAVSSVVVTLNAPSLTVGENTQAVSVARAADGVELARATTWSSSSPTVASVSPTGHVMALSPGTASIVAYIDGKIGAANVTVAAVGLPLPGPTSTIATLPELPRVYLDTRYVAPTGRTIHVSAGQNLQTTLDTAKYGDMILLQEGATFVGNFLLRPRPGSGRITLRTNTALPAEGERMTPAKAVNLAKLVSGMGATALATEGRASGWRIIGVEFTMLPHLTYGFGIVGFGEGNETTLAALPTDLVLDRVYIHGHATSDISRCLALNSAASAVIDSYLSECHGIGRDAQAIAGWSGPGPFKIVNNYLEGSGENVMFGGGSPSIPDVIPSDIEIRGNHMFKPLAWQTSGKWLVKNSFELKNARRVLIDGNVFENNWTHGQNGFAILMQSIDQEGTAPWSGILDVTFTNNIVRNSPAGIALAEAQAPMARRFLFANNLIERIGDERLLANGRMLSVANDIRDVTFSHNTFVYAPAPVVKHSAVVIIGDQSSRFVYTDNVSEGPVLIDGNGGVAGLNAQVLGWTMAGNVMSGMSAYIAGLHPTGNYYPASVSDVGFQNWLGGDVRLGALSSYRGKATDGRDPGVDYAALLQKTSRVVQP